MSTSDTPTFPEMLGALDRSIRAYELVLAENNDNGESDYLTSLRAARSVLSAVKPLIEAAREVVRWHDYECLRSSSDIAKPPSLEAGATPDHAQRPGGRRAL